ncbi:hypothetical protein D3C72_2212240 [compost metagenome]
MLDKVSDPLEEQAGHPAVEPVVAWDFLREQVAVAAHVLLVRADDETADRKFGEAGADSKFSRGREFGEVQIPHLMAAE